MTSIEINLLWPHFALLENDPFDISSGLGEEALSSCLVEADGAARVPLLPILRIELLGPFYWIQAERQNV